MGGRYEAVLIEHVEDANGELEEERLGTATCGGLCASHSNLKASLHHP